LPLLEREEATAGVGAGVRGAVFVFVDFIQILYVLTHFVLKFGGENSELFERALHVRGLKMQRLFACALRGGRRGHCILVHGTLSVLRRRV